MKRRYGVIAIGGGHAGVEAANAAARVLSSRGVAGSFDNAVALVTLRRDTIGAMSCNPAIGGIAKGQMVREIDAMGGVMGLAADATGLMFKRLNMSKGAAVRSPRAQCDRHAYARFIQRWVDADDRIDLFEAAAERFVIAEEHTGKRRVRGVVLGARGEASEHLDGLLLEADAVVLTTGTFMRGLMHAGEKKTEGGRAGEAPAVGISHTLCELGFELGRLRTGTPPRIRRSTIDWESLEPQWGDDPPTPFSDMTADGVRRGEAVFPAVAQHDCRITHTSPEMHEHIRANLDRAPMYSGNIAPGPRYCPSIEDKVVRFADKERHQVFLEPESHETDWVYCNGIATSLPVDVQEAVVRGLGGCERAEILQFGYAVEYDMVRPHQIDAGGMTRLIDGLFLAGQINGTSGYEEAGGQGLVAGLNAARRVLGEEPVLLRRDQAYIGVMMDDLVTRTPVEPYRMFTSRAEHRLLLRSDNTADRLTPLGRELGLVDDERWAVFERRREELDATRSAIDASRLGDQPLSRAIKRPGFSAGDLRDALGAAGKRVAGGVIETVLAERQYEGYITRQRAEIARHAEMERRRIPAWLDPTTLPGLRTEARQALVRFSPETLGQAGRLEGVTPADVTLLLVAMRRGPNPERLTHAAPV